MFDTLIGGFDSLAEMIEANFISELCDDGDCFEGFGLKDAMAKAKKLLSWQILLFEILAESYSFHL